MNAADDLRLLDEDERQLERRTIRDLVHPPLTAVAVARERRLGLGPLCVADTDLVAVLGKRPGEEGRCILEVGGNRACDYELARVRTVHGADDGARR